MTDASRGKNPTALIYECYLDTAEVLVWPSSRLVGSAFQMQRTSSSFFLFIRYYQHAVDTHKHFKQSVCGLLMNYCRELLMKTLSPSPSAIFLGSFRMPYEEIRKMILEVDEDQLTEPMIQVTSPLITIHDL